MQFLRRVDVHSHYVFPTTISDQNILFTTYIISDTQPEVDLSLRARREADVGNYSHKKSDIFVKVRRRGVQRRKARQRHHHYGECKHAFVM